MEGHSLGSAGTQLVSTAAREFALSDSALGFPELGTQRVILDYWLKKQAPKQNEKVSENSFAYYCCYFYVRGLSALGTKLLLSF